MIWLALPLLVGAWEGAWWAERKSAREVIYHQARHRAMELGRPLVVVGAPDRGPTRGPACGDITVDIAGSACPVSLAADITQPLPFASGSVVIFCSCVLEYVDDFDAAYAELGRVSGGELYICRVEPWTLVSVLYPGARRTLPANLPGVRNPR